MKKPTADVKGGKRQEQQAPYDRRDVGPHVAWSPVGDRPMWAARGLDTALPTRQLWAHDDRDAGWGRSGFGRNDLSTWTTA